MTGPAVTDCTECDGRGGGRCEESGAWAPCEACDGSCRLAACMQCGEPMPLPVAEREGGFCDGCRTDLDRGDQVDEMARIRRRVA